MKFRVYGEVEDTKTGQALTGAIVKLHLNKEELQQSKSAKNGFYEIIAEIDDSRIEIGQQLLITFEMEGYQRQENFVLATEGAFNLDAKLEAAPPPKKPFNRLPVVIAGGAVLFLLVVAVILFLILRPKTRINVTIVPDPFTVNPNKKVTFTAATDPESINKLEIYVNDEKVRECTSSPCDYKGGPYNLGDVTYQAYAWDGSGNMGQTEVIILTVMNFDFESGNLDGWKKNGNAFEYQPTCSDNTDARVKQPSNHQGDYWIGTAEKHPSCEDALGIGQGNEPTGTLISRDFVIQSPKVKFRVGGGSDESVGVRLLVDGKIVLEARGEKNETETMRIFYWELNEEYVNQTAQLIIFDNASGIWGHINFDDFQFVY